MPRLQLLSFLAIALLLIAPGRSLAQELTDPLSFRVVAVQGQAASGLSGGSVYKDFDGQEPVINQAGYVAFVASFDGDDTGAGVCAEGDSGLYLVARSGNQAPGTADGVLFDAPLGPPALNDSGQVAFGAALTGPGVDINANLEGLWLLDPDDGLDLVVREGDSAPGTGSEFDDLLDATSRPPHLSAAGSLGLIGTLVDGAVGDTIWTASATSISAVAARGDASPGNPTGVEFLTVGHNPDGGGVLPVINASNTTAWFAWVTDTMAGMSRGQTGLWVGTAGNLTPGVLTEDAVPGGAGAFTGMQSPDLNNAGEIAFLGYVSSGGNSNGDNTRIFAGAPGALQVVARAGDTAPGGGADVYFESMVRYNGTGVVINGQGAVAFIAEIGGGDVVSADDTGVWSNGGGTLHLVARAGRPAPGRGPDPMALPGTVFKQDTTFIPSMNGAGRVAFLGELSGGEVDDSNNRGIWAEGADGKLRMVIREGDSLPVAGEMKVIEYINFRVGSGGQDGRPRSFNDRGQIAFRVGFVGGDDAIVVAGRDPSDVVLGDGDDGGGGDGDGAGGDGDGTPSSGSGAAGAGGSGSAGVAAGDTVPDGSGLTGDDDGSGAAAGADAEGGDGDDDTGKDGGGGGFCSAQPGHRAQSGHLFWTLVPAALWQRRRRAAARSAYR